MSVTDAITEQISSVLPEVHTWPDRPAPDDLAPLPTCPALYLLVDAGALPVQLGTTQSLRRFLTSRLTDEDRRRPGKADLSAVSRGVRWRPLATPFEGRWWYYRLAREMYPREYRRLVSFGPARFLHIGWQQAVPEPRVTERIWCAAGQFVGPWPTQKACHEALEGLRDLFDLCRYAEQARKAPHGTRCAYAEMGRCDAPCDGSTPPAAYVDRCRAAWRFASGGVAEWVNETEQRMSRAAAEQQYELAGQFKQQLQFARRWQAQWAPLLRTADEFNCLIVLPVTRRRAWKLMLFRRGHLDDGPIVPQRRLGPDATDWLRTRLAEPPDALPGEVRMEQTWLVCHLMFNHESSAAILRPLPTGQVPEGLAEDLARRAADLRPPRGDSPGPSAAKP